jgi:LuxR family maltose regulon positive regulatory protein
VRLALFAQGAAYDCQSLDRLTDSLCDAVRFGTAETPSRSGGTALTGQENGQMILEMLERGNLFIVPLDTERRWYRYHHLFADAIQIYEGFSP